MLILTCLSQLQRLEEALRRSLPLALPVYGAVLNINRGNPGELEVVVDSWPNFGAILARRRGEVAGGDFFFFGGGGNGTQRGGGHWEHLRAHAVGGNRGCWGEPLGILGKGTGGTGRLAPGVRVGTLSPAHVDLLNETWPYGGNARSRRYLGELLGRYPHFCLQDGAGDPLSWTLTDHFGTGTHGYTLPGHRRHGHMRAVLSLAARQAQARGFPAFG
ncbi:GLYL3 protein, partial [Larus smithsonianus]|nr:GLYL3 protein [Larus smithsonianus]